MMGRTHLAVAVLLLFLLTRLTDLVSDNKILAGTLLIVASILPDIDHSKSILGRKVKIIGFLFKHRGFFHSIFALVLFTILIHMIFGQQNLSLIFLIGYSSHLILDMITKEGVNLFYPKNKVIKGPLRVGSSLETIFFFLLLALVIYLL